MIHTSHHLSEDVISCTSQNRRIIYLLLYYHESVTGASLPVEIASLVRVTIVMGDIQTLKCLLSQGFINDDIGGIG